MAVPSKWGKILLILQGILSILTLVQLWRTQMLPVLYLVILAALLALLWLLVKRCQEYNAVSYTHLETSIVTKFGRFFHLLFTKKLLSLIHIYWNLRCRPSCRHRYQPEQC